VEKRGDFLPTSEAIVVIRRHHAGVPPYPWSSLRPQYTTVP
jgi:hypothetical protein